MNDDKIIVVRWYFDKFTSKAAANQTNHDVVEKNSSGGTIGQLGKYGWPLEKRCHLKTS